MKRLDKNRIKALGLESEAALVHALPSGDTGALLNTDIDALLKAATAIKQGGYKATPKTTPLLVTSTIEKAEEIREAVAFMVGTEDDSPLWNFVNATDQKLADTLDLLFEDNLTTIAIDFYALVKSGYFKSASVYYDRGCQYKDAWTVSESTTDMLALFSFSREHRQPYSTYSFPPIDRLNSRVLGNMRHPASVVHNTVLNAAYNAISGEYFGTLEMLSKHGINFSMLSSNQVDMVYSKYEKSKRSLAALECLTKVGKMPKLTESLSRYPGLHDDYIVMEADDLSKEASARLTNRNEDNLNQPADNVSSRKVMRI